MYRPIIPLLLLCGSVANATAAELPTNVALRGSLANSRIRFEREKQGHVAFIGGSITEMNGYRPMVCEMLRQRSPKTNFQFTDAGIASTCSTTGAFRLDADVLSRGRVDLFFIEFAVNDDQDAGHARRECIRGLEGIIRHTRRHNPQADIVVTYFTNPGMVETLQAGKVPLSIAAHADVCRHYNVSTIDLAKEVAERISADKLTWKQYGGTHPAPLGNRIGSDMIDGLLNVAWKGPLAATTEPVAHALPTAPLDSQNYEAGKLLDPSTARADSQWKWHVPDWKNLPGNCRSRFSQKELLSTTQAGSELTLTFTGRAVGAYVLAGPDAGILEARIDDGKPKRVDLYHRFSRGLHYPRTVMFSADLAPGPHTLHLRVSKSSNAQSRGHAVRILQFVSN